MTVKFDVSLLGSAEVVRKVQQLAPKILSSIERKSMTVAARAMVKVVQSEIPVLTGAMKKSVKSRVIKKRRGKNIRGRVVSVSDPGALPLELGTPRHQPNPFMTRAAKKGRGVVSQIFRQQLRELARQAIK